MNFPTEPLIFLFYTRALKNMFELNLLSSVRRRRRQLLLNLNLIFAFLPFYFITFCYLHIFLN